MKAPAYALLRKIVGAAGRGITNAVINGAGRLLFTYSDGSSQDVGKVTGENGVGTPGRGVTNATVNGSGRLVLTYSDGTTQDTGYVIGAAGKSVTSATVNGSGRLIITASDGSTIDAGVVTGLQGRGITSATVNGSGRLILTLTDASTIDTGYVIGAAGKSVTSAVINGSGNLILTMSDGSTIDAGVARAAPTTMQINDAVTAYFVANPPLQLATATPLAGTTTGAVGTGTKAAREDHRHPADLPLVGTVAIGETAIVAIALGIRERTVALTGAVVGAKYNAYGFSYQLNGGSVVNGRPAGYSIIDCVCNTANQITISLNAPLLAIGASYIINCAVHRVTT